MHNFQHFYVWIFYGLSTLSWVTTKDYVRINRYHQMGFLSKKNEYKKEILKLTAWKLAYYVYILILPMLLLPIAPWLVLLAFLGMHFITGLLISTVFQVAHIMPDNAFPLPDENGNISNDWYTHQMATTANFSPKGHFFSWLIGGLNFQIEHHLLPNICHIHYKNISVIVAETAKEFNMPYYSKRTFGAAIYEHFKMLRQLGSMH